MQLGRKIMYTEIKQMIVKDEEVGLDMPSIIFELAVLSAF
jgi:hypothetical protein